MPDTGTITLVGAVAVVVLVVVYLKLRAKDGIDAAITKRRGSSKLVSRAEYVEGAEKIPVALALTDSTFFYENADLEASFDLDRLDEIEYDDDLATGANLHAGSRVLRLRSHGATFEFVLDKGEAAKWEAALPRRTYGGGAAQAPQAAHAV
jgi:hypothetical protein